MNADIVILGEGLAAYAAALELKDSGKDVLVVSPAPGRSALNSGAWDLADHPLRRSSDAGDRGLDLRENISEILRLQEFHPYTVFAGGGDPKDFVDFLFEKSARAAADLGLPFSAPHEANRLFLTCFGSLHPAAFVQASMQQAAISSLAAAKVLVAGIRGFPAFSSRFIAEALLERQNLQSEKCVEFCGSFDMELDGISAPSIEPFAMAAHLDREENFVGFGKKLVEYLQGKVYSHVFLPPVMGLKNTSAILQAVEAITGMKAAETLAAPSSVPGFRLQQAIRRFFSDRGIRTVAGEAVGFEDDGSRIKSLRVADEEQGVRIVARAFLLATGKYLGGGIARREEFCESVFGLPVFLGGKILRRETVLSLARPEARESQPFFSAGVAVNAGAQALGENGRVRYDNLFAAGSVLAGFDPSHDRCAEGVAILSGTIAAQSALQV